MSREHRIKSISQPWDILTFPPYPTGIQAIALHTNTISTVSFRGRKYVCKEEKSPAVAKTEALSQELRRAFIPETQPPHLIASNTQTGVYYVLSEYVEGLRELQKNSLSDAHYYSPSYGLGKVNATDIWLGDNDAKNGNVAMINEPWAKHYGAVIRLDGDQSLVEAQDRYQIPTGALEITKKLLTSLPHPGADYKPYNWLEFTHAGITNPTSPSVSKSLNKNKLYKSELYETFYKIIITPDMFLENMVDACFASGGERYLNLLQKRRYTLGVEALKIKEFRKYIKSPATAAISQAHLDSLKSFIFNYDFKVIPVEDEAKLEQELMSRIAQVDSFATPPETTYQTTHTPNISAEYATELLLQMQQAESYTCLPALPVHEQVVPLMVGFNQAITAGAYTMIPDFTATTAQLPQLPLNRMEKAPTALAETGQKRGRVEDDESDAIAEPATELLLKKQKQNPKQPNLFQPAQTNQTTETLEVQNNDTAPIWLR